MNPILTKCGTGIAGLDDVLRGGLPRACLHLIEGKPGAGKTTLAMQFLMEGRNQGERCLYVTLSETRMELEAVAISHGWDLEGIEIIELSSMEREISAKKGSSTLFHSADVELTQLTRMLVEAVERGNHDRVVFDSLSEMRILAQSPLRFRREILGLKQSLAKLSCTVLLLDDRSTDAKDAQVHSIVHGALTLDVAPLRFGIFRRSLSITKMRGVSFREGNHDYAIALGGLQLFPRLVAADNLGAFKRTLARTGSAEMDALLGGGLHFGTSNLFIGPAGSGKSTIAAMIAHAAAERGEQVKFFTFDESRNILCERAAALKNDLVPYIDSGRIVIEQMDPASISPGELAFRLRRAVESEEVKVVVLDSLNGYMNAMPDDDFLHLHLHELITYLNQHGVLTIMILAQHGLVGAMGTPVDVSYLADSVVITRFFEAVGSIRKAVSIVKKRSGAHENTVRELTLSSERGVLVGAPLVEFQGVLTGVPSYLGAGRASAGATST